MTEDEPVLTAAIQVVYLDMISKGEKLIALNREHLEAEKERDIGFLNDLDTRLLQLKEEIQWLNEKHAHLLSFAEEQFKARVTEGCSLAEQSLIKTAEDCIADFAERAATEVQNKTVEGLGKVFAYLSSVLDKIGKDQQAATKEFVAVSKRQEEATNKAIRRMEVGAENMQERLTAAARQVSWSWTKQLAMGGAIITLSVILGFAVGQWLITRFPPTYSENVRLALNNSRFLDAFWDKLSKAEQARLTRLTGRVEGE